MACMPTAWNGRATEAVRKPLTSKFRPCATLDTFYCPPHSLAKEVWRRMKDCISNARGTVQSIGKVIIEPRSEPLIPAAAG